MIAILIAAVGNNTKPRKSKTAWPGGFNQATSIGKVGGESDD